MDMLMIIWCNILNVETKWFCCLCVTFIFWYMIWMLIGNKIIHSSKGIFKMTIENSQAIAWNLLRLLMLAWWWFSHVVFAHSFLMHPFSIPWKYQVEKGCIGNKWVNVLLTVWCLVSVKRLQIPKQSCSWKLYLYLSMCDLPTF